MLSKRPGESAKPHRYNSPGHQSQNTEWNGFLLAQVLRGLKPSGAGGSSGTVRRFVLNTILLAATQQDRGIEFYGLCRHTTPDKRVRYNRPQMGFTRHATPDQRIASLSACHSTPEHDIQLGGVHSGRPHRLSAGHSTPEHGFRLGGVCIPDPLHRDLAGGGGGVQHALYTATWQGFTRQTTPVP